MNELNLCVYVTGTDGEYMKSIWIPDTCFPNEKKAAFHHTTVNQTFLHLRNTGQVTSFQS